MAEKFGEKKDKSAAEMRKINKPLMERKRRERINNCLNQLKMFLMETTKKDSSYYSKLEKADILELTVKYLKSLQRQQLAASTVTDPKVASKFTAGYSQCASEVSRYLGNLDGFSPEVQNRLLTHITGCVQKVANSAAQTPIAAPVHSTHTHAQLGGEQQGIFSSMAASAQARSESPEVPTMTSSPAALPTVMLPGGQTMYLNNMPQQPQSQQQQGQQQQSQQQQNVPVLPVQLIPAKLPSGDMVFIMANTQATVPMATNFVTSPMSIQIASGTSSRTVTTTSTNTLPGLTTNSSGAYSFSSSSLPASFSHVATGGVASTLGLPVAFGSGTGAHTSVAVVPPNVHECKPSPSSLPTDLSMKSTTVTSSMTSEEMKPEVTQAISLVTRPTSVIVPDLKPETLGTARVVGCGVSLLSVVAETGRHVEDKNNNLMGDDDDDDDDIMDEDDNTSRSSSPDDASSRRSASSPKPEPEAAQGNAGLGMFMPEPSGFGPMWRPW